MNYKKEYKFVPFTDPNYLLALNKTGHTDKEELLKLYDLSEMDIEQCTIPVHESEFTKEENGNF